MEDSKDAERCPSGKDLPPEFHDLPAGGYLVEQVDEQAPTLTLNEDAGIEEALESYGQGRAVGAKRARAIVDAVLGC